MNNNTIILAGVKTLRNSFRIVHREFTGMHQAAMLLAFAGILAKILALARDRLLASTFGAGLSLDIYYAAFRVPDFIYTLSLVLSASTALIPILLEREAVGHDEAKKFISSITGWFLIFMVFVGVISYFLMPAATSLITPGFDQENQSEVALLSRILLLQAILLGLSNIASAIIQSARKFAVYAISPILYNFGIIAGIWWLYPVWGLTGITFGVVIGALLHLLMQLPSIISLGYLPKFSLVLTPAIKRAILLSVPRSFGGSLSQSVFMVITALASTLGAGGIAIFNLSYNLQNVPLTIIGVSYSIAAFPFLANITGSDLKRYLAYFSSALRHIIFWSLPATALIIILRAHIVRIILGTGLFGWEDTRLTAAALAIFSISLTAQGLIALYARAFYAAGHTKIPFLVNLTGSALTIILSFGFLYLYSSKPAFRLFANSTMRVPDIKNADILMLPLAFSIGSLANLAMLAYYFRKIWGKLDGGAFAKSISQIASASTICGVSALMALRLSDQFLKLETFANVATHGFIAGLVGVGAGIAFLIVTKNAELIEIKNVLRVRLWPKTPIIAREPSTGTEL